MHKVPQSCLVVLAWSLLVVCSVAPARADTRYSPQLAIGSAGGLRAQASLTFINASTTSQEVTVSAYDFSGEPLVVRGTGTVIDGSFHVVLFHLQPGRTLSETLFSDGALERGWLRFDLPDDATGEGVVVQATLQNLDAEGRVLTSVGVPIQGAAQDYFMAVQSGEFEDVGVAIVNPDLTSSATVTLALFNELGTPGIYLPITLTLGPGEQIARFVSTGREPFFPLSSPMVDFVLSISSDRPVGVLGLRSDFGGQFVISGIPVVRGAFP